MTVVKDYGQFNGQTLRGVTISDGDATLSVLNYGATTRDWRVPLNGQRIPVLLGYNDPERYLTCATYFGAIAGRVSNRIGSAQYSLGGQSHQLVPNEGANQLHGGPAGLSKVFWDIELDGPSAVRLQYNSPAGENGFPGCAKVTVDIRLDGARVTYDMRAEVDYVTPISLAQHNYYNLGGGGSIWDHRMRCQADRVLEMDEQGIMTGEISPVDGTRFDFQQMRSFAEADESRLGIDHNLVFEAGRNVGQPVSEVEAPNGMRLKFWSDQPGGQLYTAAAMPPQDGGLDGQTYGPAAGFCFEPQGFPNAVNIPSFPSVLVSPEMPYSQKLQVEIKGN
ncbi:hypothetical protein A9Q94_11605 [Rhodobacterales bacterium 56_14_T64]|nr:hypothetical protein A9Q94_11605 [Rhodobacterales bacterium 56_14_T64]